MTEDGNQPDVVGRLLERREGFSRSEQDAVLDDVFARVAAEEEAVEARAGHPWWIRVAAAAAVLALIAVPTAWLLQSEPEFTARGAEGVVRVSCTGEGACTRGDELVFEVAGIEEDYMAAFARNDEGDIVWYFPESPGGRSHRVSDGLLERAVTIGREHSAGSWAVHAVFTDRPLSRGEVKEVFDADGELVDESARLITRELTVE